MDLSFAGADPALGFLVLFAVAFAINLLPAFGPPTWTVVVLFGINSDLPLPGIVLTGALAAASGRFVLAHGYRLLAKYVGPRTKANLAAVRAAFERRKHRGLLALGLFALSPLPSAQLFGAIGLAGVRILPFTLAFFAGRLVSYAFYGLSATALHESSLGEAFQKAFSSPVGVAVQVIMLAGLVALARIDWVRIFGPAPQDGAGGS
ncbi:MAG: hypothetical protein IE933_06880 [Sphingomonadales bacterium]|nr:hypothetical protein [Sphingomonadales bacterium]MBD3773063.1 hypothetical protein [Paracoccaceae bacterium]